MKLNKVAKIAGKGIVLVGACAASAAAIGLATIGTTLVMGKVTNAAANPRLWKSLLCIGAEYAVSGAVTTACMAMVYPATVWFVDEVTSH